MLTLVRSQPAATLQQYWARHWACAVDVMELLATIFSAGQAAEGEGQPGGAGAGQPGAAEAGQMGAAGGGQTTTGAADTFGTVKASLYHLMTTDVPFGLGECFSIIIYAHLLSPYTRYHFPIYW